MELGITHRQSQRLLRQRNILAIAAAGLFALCVILTLLAASRDREVVLQPVLPRPLTLTSGRVDKDYLELVTRDAALLTLNRSPSNLQYWMDAILGLTDPRTHGRMKAELLKVFNEQSGSNVSQYFTIETLKVDPDHLTSEVSGVLHTVVGSKDVTEEARTFRYVWSYSGVSLKLAAFGRVIDKAKQDAANPGDETTAQTTGDPS
jgi:conjugal transfer pilus assembly protein TraE